MIVEFRFNKLFLVNQDSKIHFRFLKEVGEPLNPPLSFASPHQPSFEQSYHSFAV